MKTSINVKGINGEGNLSDYIDRRLSFAFSRTQHAIDNFSMTVTDVNGPKGGIDKKCQVVINAQGLPSVVISEKQSDLRLAIDRCLARASQSLTRKLKRKQHSRTKKESIKRSLVQMEI